MNDGATSYNRPSKSHDSDGKLGILARRCVRLSGAAVLLLLGACVDLTRPSFGPCADDSRACRPDARDARSDDAPAEDAPTPDRPPAEVVSPGEVLPGTDVAVETGAEADGVRPEPGGPDSRPPEAGPPDLPRDNRPPDLDTNGPVDAGVDRPPDLTPADTRPPTPPRSCPTGEPGLLLCLRFEGALVDESPPAAALTGANLSYEPGPSELAVKLGAASSIHVAQGWATIASTYTLEAWIRPERLPAAAQRAGLLDEGAHFGMFILPGGTLSCSSSGASALVPDALRVGQWTALSCTLNGLSLTAWVDGVARAVARLDDNQPEGMTSLAIGGNNPTGDPFEGHIDNVRIWSRVRTPQQICEAAIVCP